jgi:hypothetical protein
VIAADPAWPAGGLAICTATADQTSIKAVADNNGGIFVCWSDTRSGTAKNYATRTCARGETTGTDGSGRSAGTVRGQLRDSGFNFQWAWSRGTGAGPAAANA